MFEWTEVTKQQTVDKYLAAEPTAENTMEIVAELAEELGTTVNKVRHMLVDKDVYIKKTAATSTKAASGTSGGRVSKEGAQQTLVEAIEKAGKTVDMDIISKLTGKAAVYFAGLFE